MSHAPFSYQKINARPRPILKMVFYLVLQSSGIKLIKSANISALRPFKSQLKSKFGPVDRINSISTEFALHHCPLRKRNVPFVCKISEKKTKKLHFYKLRAKRSHLKNNKMQIKQFFFHIVHLLFHRSNLEKSGKNLKCDLINSRLFEKTFSRNSARIQFDFLFACCTKPIFRSSIYGDFLKFYYITFFESAWNDFIEAIFDEFSKKYFLWISFKQQTIKFKFNLREENCFLNGRYASLVIHYSISRSFQCLYKMQKKNY